MAFGFGEIVTMLINGLVIASTLFIVASGLSIVFGVSRISNFAHGSLYMIGAYVAWTAAYATVQHRTALYRAGQCCTYVIICCTFFLPGLSKAL